MAEKLEKTYKIGGRTYVQRPLVLGQLRQLEELMKDLPWEQNLTAAELVRLLGDRFPEAAAIILRPQAIWPLSLLYAPRRKNVKRLARRLGPELDLVTCFELVSDFFTCNPVRSLLTHLAGALRNSEALKKAQPASTPSASSSAGETSPEENASSGGTPSPSADPTSSTGDGTSSTGKPSSASSA